MKSNSFILIQGWMVTELKLKSNELLVFAIIYGFSKDNQGKFDGSLKYLSDATGSSRSTVIKTLHSLLEKNLILKEVVTVNNIQFCKYFQNEPVVLNSYGGGSILSDLGSTKTTPNSITNNNIDNNKENNNSQTLISEDLLKTNEKEKRETKFFVDSVWNDFELVKNHFVSKPDLLEKYAYCDLKYYINKVDIWSENSGKKRTDRGWIGTIIDFIDKAKIAGNMQLITKPQKQQGHINF